MSLPCVTISLFTISAPPVKKKQTLAITNVTFTNDAPNSHVPGINFLEFLVHALSITSYITAATDACKSHTVSVEKPLYFLLRNTCFGWSIVYILTELKYNTSLKTYNAKVNCIACEITLLLSSAVCTLCSLVSKQRFTRNFSVS